MKCLPQNKISQAQGLVLHDWHAEILAIRSLNRFLLEECHALASQEKTSSEYVRFRSPDERNEFQFQPFALNNEIDLHMYCSEAPCTFIYVAREQSHQLTISQAVMQAWNLQWQLKPTLRLG